MSEHLQTGMHPEPDSLNAFIEGVLPEHERLECLAHLADCARCREIVFAAQEPAAAEEPVREPWWKRWLGPIPALTSAAVAAALLVSVVAYRNNKPAELPLPPAPTQMAPVPQPAPQAIAKAAPPTTPPARKTLIAPQPLAAPIMLPPAPPPANAPAAIGQTNLAIRNAAPAAAPPSVEGRVTDATGGSIAGAVVTVTPAGVNTSGASRTDPQGQFAIAGLLPGQYDLQISAPGFTRVSKKVEVQPDAVAQADAILPVGSAAESVEVAAANPKVNTEASTLSRSARVLIRKTPAAAMLSADPSAPKTVTNGKITLMAGTNGELLRSTNAGKSWKPVKPVWQGKVVRLVAPPDVPAPPKTAFQLTTDTGANWFSQDGSHWTPAPSQH